MPPKPAATGKKKKKKLTDEEKKAIEAERLWLEEEEWKRIEEE